MNNYPYDPKAFRQFHLYTAMHAPLIKRYQLGQGHVLVGEASTYGRSDPETGAFYIAQAHEEYNERKKKRVIMASTDYECGAFYPETLFIDGHGNNQNDSLSFDQLEEFKKRFCPTPTIQVLVPRGWDPKRGGWTWRPTLQYLPDMCPWWSDVVPTLKRQFPDGEIYAERHCQMVSITLGQHEAMPSTNPALGDEVLRQFKLWSGASDEATVGYSHGSWDVIAGGDAPVIYGVYDAEDEQGKHYFKFMKKDTE